MAGHIPEHIIAQIQSSTDIVSLISQYVPGLKKAGRAYKGLCPFHKEKTPSFTVNSEEQFFHCFGCKEGGSAFKFLMLIEHLTFPEAVHNLADRTGIQIPDTRDVDPRQAAAARTEREKIYDALQRAASFFASQLQTDSGARARSYLDDRRIGSSTQQLWQLGFAPNSWDSLLKYLQGQSISGSVLEKAGLVSSRNESTGYYDRFRDRLMFPIIDARDRVIGFGARTLNDEQGPKYLNSPETVAFNKSECLYGLNRAKSAIADKGIAVIVEGYTDVLMTHQLGVQNVVATLGTALTRKHVELLRRYARRVALVYDADEAGEKASDRSIDVFLEEDFDVSIATLNEGMDPCDYALEHGPQAFEERIQQAQEILAFKLDRAHARHDFSRMDGRARATDEILQLIPKIANEVKKSLFLQRAASELGVSESSLRARTASLDRRRPQYEDAAPAGVQPKSANASQIAQRDVISYLMKFPEDSPALFHKISIHEFADQNFQTIFQVICDQYEEEGAVDAVKVLSMLETRWPEHPAGRIAAEIMAAGDDESLRQRLAGTLDWFDKQRKLKEVSSLKEQMKEAQSSGDSKRLMELMKQAQASLNTPASLETPSTN